MINIDLEDYKEAFLQNNIEKLRLQYFNIQSKVSQISLENLQAFFLEYSEKLICNFDFLKFVFSGDDFNKKSFFKNVNGLIEELNSQNSIVLLYDLLLYSPDLLLKTLYFYSPKDLLKLNHYPENPTRLGIDFKINGEDKIPIVFYISDEQTNYPDVYFGRAMSYNGSQKDFVYDYHLPLPFLISKYFPKKSIHITSDYEKIKDSMYIYQLTFRDVHQFFNKQGSDFFSLLPKQVLNDFKGGKCIIIYNSLHESFNFSKYFHHIFAAFKGDLKERAIHNFYILTGNAYDINSLSLYQKGMPIISKDISSVIKNSISSWSNRAISQSLNISYFDFFEETMAAQKINFYQEYSYETKLGKLNAAHQILHFLCLNRVVKDFRLATSFFFYNNNLLDKTALSQGLVTDKQVLKSKLIQDISKDNLEQFLETLPYHLDSNTLSPNFWNILPLNTINQSFLWVVTETLFGNKWDSKRYPFITEKTYKPIMLFMPFVMIGNYKMLELLKSKGYKTFARWWDESYDDEPNPLKRLNKVFETLSYIATFTTSDLLRIYEEMRDILIHNNQILLSNQSAKQIITEIVEIKNHKI